MLNNSMHDESFCVLYAKPAQLRNLEGPNWST